MAKKKKKAAKKATKKAAKGEAATLVSCSAEELTTAGVLTSGGELVAELADVVSVAVQHAISEFMASRGAENQRETSRSADRVDRVIDLVRTVLRAKDSRRPCLRVVGRVAEILLHHRGFETISAGDVYLVFLAEIPGEIPETYRQYPPLGENFSVSTGEGRKTFNNRIRDLRDFGLIRATATKGNRQEDHVLTEDGALVFDNWPELTEIPGLELEPRGRTTR